ncbi:chemotaxis protein [Duganella sp. FT109W]|uniref:Chemotaxis protein n=1 Tax=Duganella margarita TaxID=2692170 RepID=A0ABW9WF07_9BURK|nr:methyl-accepting chemotaxis protein [Duganella margarita]MYN39581.1 chemotaxis protein [Duganella margarita]
MNFLFKQKIGTQLTLGFGMVTALMMLLATVSLLGVTSINSAFQQQNAIAEKRLNPLYQAREALAQTGLAARNAYIFTDETQAARELTIVDDQKALYLAALTEMTPAFAGDPEFDKVRTGLLAMADALKQPRRLREAGNMEAFGKFLVNECSPLRRQIVADIAMVLKKTERQMADATELSESAASSARLWTLVLTVTAFLLSLLIASLIKRGLLKQLGGEPAYATDIANRISHGDLATEVVVAPGDQSSLLFAIKTMRDSLSSIVGQVREGTEAINSASAEIAQGNEDLAGRTGQQASALEKVATAMEELTSTVKQNASNAQQANTLARSASQVSEQGGEVMQQVTATMESINASSKQIVEIISVINSIAFQTNILALNAAVEAARAGDQGRGFAVVASEVRSLAQRSASAAKEIKALIDDSVAKVGSGSELVQKAGSTMHEVVASVKRVTEIMGEISIASTEQSAGIEEVSVAIGDMDGMTQQNMALVEEASAAALEMQQQATALSHVVDLFKVSAEQPAAAPRPSTGSAHRGMALRLSY